MADVSMEEVAEQFRQALRGDIKVRLVDDEWSWNHAWCGNVDFWFGDWRVTFFNDCDDLDYTDGVVTPDGRRAEFDDWCSADFIGCPLNLLTSDEHAALERLISEAA